MSEHQIPRSQKDEIRELLNRYYPKRWSGLLVERLTKNGLTIKKRSIPTFFFTEVQKYGKEIIVVSLEMIREAQNGQKELSKEVGKLVNVQNVDSQKIAS